MLGIFKKIMGKTNEMSMFANSANNLADKAAQAAEKLKTEPKVEEDVEDVEDWELEDCGCD